MEKENKPIKSFWMPPEWEKHERTFVAWPVKESMVYPENYDSVCAGYLKAIEAISMFEPVTVLVNREEEAARDCNGSPFPIQWVVVPHNDSWIRDSGPTFVWEQGKNRVADNVQGSSLAGLNWIFNAWGEKYAPWDRDNALAGELLAFNNIQKIDVPLVMEGGSFHTDGEGTLLTTKECLLNQNRNPQLSQKDIETQLHRYLGTNTVVWLNRGLDGDETDGHVDNVACFAAPGHVMVQVCEEFDDENFLRSKENMQILEAARDAKGKKLTITKIPQPPKMIYMGHRLTLSYINFCFVNGGILLPLFGGTAEETDRKVLQIFEKTFPKRKIHPIDGLAFIAEGGNVHCATQQMPKKS